LYEQWDVETKKIIDRLDSIAKKIDDTEKKETSISSRIKDLLRSIKINFNRQKDKIGTLKAESEHFRFLENGELKDRIKRINEIYKEVDSSVANFEEDDRKAKLDDDIDKLQIEIGDKEKNQKEKEENLAREKEENPKRIEVFCAEFIKQKKAEIEARLENLREEISSIENETEKAKKIEQKKRDEFAVNNLSIDYSTNQKGLNKIKGDLDKKAGKDQRGKDPDTAEQADVLLRDFKNIKESDLFISTTEKEIDAIKIEIKTIENNIAQKEKEKNKINSTSQSTKGSALYNVLSNIKQDKNKPADKPEQKEGLSVPSYPHLPKTGTLHQGDGKNYLSINDWDEFEEAQKEAKRLDAILCAERG
jgi:chromosome segregation ATPase